ncbi:M81 family metallopeptidase [Niabella beijingensis]|uniref:M81 family metallopeptidase n=1 Tax=Niabella beijingensis TaxID=2872700 RepID=UPI001CC0A42D|nr:M81 family metallopeptidase [Niabella beijingensis]MBZ4191397.1 M81 family metallopeptidase [Niabella beijingensis]
MKKIALIGIYHESNTFNKRPTVYADFVNGHLLKGADIVAHYKNAHHEIGGFIEALNDAHIELIPVMYAEAAPGGTVTTETYLRLKAELGALLQQVLPVDGVLVAPHGAGVCEDYPDMDGDWLSYVRALVGTEVPIVGTLDPHANVSLLMIEKTNALFAYATNPHLDQRATGIKAAQLLKRLLFENTVFRQRLIQLPLSISIEQQNTNCEPCLSLYREVQRTAADHGALHVSIILGFPYADVPEMGTSLILITEGDSNWEQLITQLRSCFFSRLQQFRGEKLRLQAVLPDAGALKKPVLLLDMGDNVGGGAAGTSMYLMDLLEAAGQTRACICITHAATVEAIARFETGDRFELSFGHIDTLNREAPYSVTLISRGDGFFTEPDPRHGGQSAFNMGKVVVLKTANQNTIIVSSLKVPPFSSRQLTSLGIVLEEQNWIIAKGVNAPIAAFKDSCATILQVDTPGETCADITTFSFKNRSVPLYPFEAIRDV